MKVFVGGIRQAVFLLRRKVGPNGGKPAQKKISKKLVKLTHHSYSSNSLTNFEYKGFAMTGNGNYENLA
jgi:hypothetical protein